MMALLTIVGGGPGDLAMMSDRVKAAIGSAGRVLTNSRQLDCCRTFNEHAQSGSPDEICKALVEEVSDTVVVVSGDTGFYSLAKTLWTKFSDRYTIDVLPGISSLQMLCARIGTGYEDVEVVSVHGVDRPAVGPAAYCGKVFYLTGGPQGANILLEELCQAGLGKVMATVGENLSAPDERILRGTVAQLCATPIGPLAVVLVENPTPMRLHRRLRDEDFIRGDVPMTKEAVRVLSVSRMEVRPGDIVYDIGAGTGAMSVALARIAWKGAVYAIEHNPDAIQLIEKNRDKFMAYNIVPVQGTAPSVMQGLPAPDCVFIGGTSGKIEEIVDALVERADHFNICINAVTLETINTAMQLMESRGFIDVEVECINAAKARYTGRSHLMLGQNPVYIISGRWSK